MILLYYRSEAIGKKRRLECIGDRKDGLIAEVEVFIVPLRMRRIGGDRDGAVIQIKPQPANLAAIIFEVLIVIQELIDYAIRCSVSIVVNLVRACFQAGDMTAEHEANVRVRYDDLLEHFFSGVAEVSRDSQIVVQNQYGGVILVHAQHLIHPTRIFQLDTVSNADDDKLAIMDRKSRECCFAAVNCV